jgi:hypothetical protein
MADDLGGGDQQDGRHRSRTREVRMVMMDPELEAFIPLFPTGSSWILVT